MKPLNFQSIIFSYSTILILFICSILFASVNLLGQISKSEFKEVMEGDGNKGTKIPESDATGYKSFVQNEFQNIFTKISDLEEQDIQEITFAEINNKRIELAK